MSDRRPAVFLDRDGVLNENLPEHVRSWSAFRFLPRAVEGIVRLTRAGWPVVVVTNQSGISRGFIAANVLDEIHGRLRAAVEAAGGRIDAILHCPHTAEDGCDCRKPRPGMLLDAARRLNLDLARSFLVGDHVTDVDAAAAVGCRAIVVRTGRGHAALERPESRGGRDLVVVDDLYAAVDVILAAGAAPSRAEPVPGG